MIAVKLGYDRLSNVATATNFCFFLFSIHTFFRHRPMCNKLCAFSHDALDHRRCNTRDRPSTIPVGHTNTPGNWQCRLGTDIPRWTFPLMTLPWHLRATGYDKKCKCCARRSLTQANQLPHKLTTRGKVLSWEYRSPRKRNSRPSSTNHCPQAVLLLIYYRKTI